MTDPDPPASGRKPSNAEKAGYLALLVLLVTLGFHWGYRLGAKSARASTREEFFPVWATAAPENVPLLVLDTDSALGRLNLQPKQLQLKDLARLHGHLCDGLVISWIELRAALRELFPRGIVDRTDLRVVSKNGPCWVDAAAWMTGARVNHGTLVLDDGVGDGFIVQRISTGEAVHVWLHRGIFPKELADTERSIRTRRAAGEAVKPEEIDEVEFLAAEFGRRLLSQPPEELLELERLSDFSFSSQSPDLIVARSDIINRDLARASKGR